MPPDRSPLAVSRSEIDQSATSLWRQVKRALRDLASSQQPGSRLPTEGELCTQFGVSRTTVRQAVNSLVAEGVLFSRQGSGTYVAPAKLGEEIAGLQSLVSTRELISRRGGSPTIRVMGVDTIPPDVRLKDRLAVTDKELVYKIRRLRLSDGEVVATQVTYLSQRLFPGLGPADFASSALRDLLGTRYGLEFSHVDATLEVGTADQHHAEPLGIAVGAPLVIIERVWYVTTGTPVIFSRIFHRHDRYRMQMRIDLVSSP
ncbi:MAG: UTRA domain-containing protein [Streptosporangiales bacterium]|nr:UTRA domain-containing protein [Streptosporangiales bacterium]